MNFPYIVDAYESKVTSKSGTSRNNCRIWHLIITWQDKQSMHASMTTVETGTDFFLSYLAKLKKVPKKKIPLVMI